jgi:hypothetical protein
MSQSVADPGVVQGHMPLLICRTFFEIDHEILEFGKYHCHCIDHELLM